MRTPTGASVSCSGVRSPKMRHGRPERDDREREERRDRGQDRGQEVDRLVGERRHDVFLERQLQPVGEALQVAARADPVGADPLLHAGDDLALEDDREQRQHDQDDEDADDLDEQRSTRRRCRSPPASAVSCASRSRRTSADLGTTAPGPAPEGRAALAARVSCIGSHTTRSGIGASRAGRVTAPRPVRSRSPVAVGHAEPRPRWPGPSRATGGRRGAGQLRLVALQRAGVEQLPPGGQHGLAAAGPRRLGPRPPTGRPQRGRRAVPTAASSARSGLEGRQPAGRRPSRRRGRAAPGRRSAAPVPCSVASKGATRPSQSRNVPAFSAAAATGRTTSACSVTADRGTSPG